MIGLLVVTGLISGFINTLAGGGSMITLPALMMMGMPADIANATNRIGVLMQSVTSVKGFKDKGRLDQSAIVPLLVVTIAGALAGSLLASYLPVWLLKPVLLGAMVTMAVVILVRPETIAPMDGTEAFSVSDRPLAGVGLFLSGVYGGFVQAGVGFILIAALAGGLRYDLVRTNALKSVCTAIFSAVALAVFALRGQVWWVPGLILAVGSIAGAWLSVRFAISVSQNTLKWILFIMVLATCAGALYF
ncbi:MAG: sulfite exporter TauE/SafE family protein [Gammaproteobacteria bacterium]|nr:sulfite exporter TauE/SafE family protein [Gammaproteobacteria bacterium]MBT7369101.1 sulfite exporter TauE/SafE family protein [Gammaproteobacteria bacterium]